CDDRRRDDDRVLVVRVDDDQVAGAAGPEAGLAAGLCREGQSRFQAKFEGNDVVRPFVLRRQT
ncbi:hypothetical protein K0M31_008373, partial [Melipona bicolor]